MRLPSASRPAVLLLVALGASGCAGGVRAFDRAPVASTVGVPPPERPGRPAAVAIEPMPAPAPCPPPPRDIASVKPPAPRESPRAAAPRPAPPPPETAAAPPVDDPEGHAMLDAVNHERVARGLRPLRWDERLHRAALEHSAEQARHGYLGHGSPDPARDDLRDRERLVGYEPHKWAEVVGWNYTGPEHVCRGWMDSRGHRAILLDPTLLDAGFARVGTYFTGDFGIPRTVPGTGYAGS